MMLFYLEMRVLAERACGIAVIYGFSLVFSVIMKIDSLYYCRKDLKACFLG